MYVEHNLNRLHRYGSGPVINYLAPYVPTHHVVGSWPGFRCRHGPSGLGEENSGQVLRDIGKRTVGQ
jgi:hypothetical protein